MSILCFDGHKFQDSSGCMTAPRLRKKTLLLGSVLVVWTLVFQFKLTESYRSFLADFSPEQGNRTQLKESKKIVLMTRTFSGDRGRVGSGLLHHIRMFLDFSSFDFRFVLDDESQDDHLWGDCLQEALPESTIGYEALPEGSDSLFHGIAFGNRNQKYARPGYDRQQWSTFHLDLLADTQHEVIGVIDGDASLFSYVTRESIFAPDGRIILRAANAPDHYHMDKVALGFPTTPYDFMWIDRMPIWFWKSTFAKVRNHISGHWGSSFNDAFRNFSISKYSQFNIMAHYALVMEPDRYVLVDHRNTNGTISVGCNRCLKYDVHMGCCSVFGVGCNTTSSRFRRSEIAHGLNRFNNYKVAWEKDTSLLKSHLLNVQREVSRLESRNHSMLESMRDACVKFTAGIAESGCSA